MVSLLGAEKVVKVIAHRAERTGHYYTASVMLAGGSEHMASAQHVRLKDFTLMGFVAVDGGDQCCTVVDAIAARDRFSGRIQIAYIRIGTLHR